MNPINLTYTVFYVLILIGACLHLYFDRKPRMTKRVLEIFLVWVLVAGGLIGLYAFWGHIFFPDKVARFIGWPEGNPFQFEVGIANLMLGVLGVLCIWIRGHFWIATVIANSIMGLGCAVGHIIQIAVAGNFFPGNAGMVLYIDILGPILGIVLLLTYLNAKKFPEGV